MKYIRTKDGVYNTSELIKCEDKRIPDGWFTKTGAPLIAIKVADTIEELCDEFVIVYENNGYVVLSNLAQVRLYRGKHGFSNSQVYGAIWTDKGLQYAAKMNEKGELELI